MPAFTATGMLDLITDFRANYVANTGDRIASIEGVTKLTESCEIRIGNADDSVLTPFKATSRLGLLQAIELVLVAGTPNITGTIQVAVPTDTVANANVVYA